MRKLFTFLLLACFGIGLHASEATLTKEWTVTDYSWNTGAHARSMALKDGTLFVTDKNNKKLQVLKTTDGSFETSIDDGNFTGFSVTTSTAGDMYITSSAWGMTNNIQGTMKVGTASTYKNTPVTTGGRIDFVSAYGDFATEGYLAGAGTAADFVAVWKIKDGDFEDPASPTLINGKRGGSGAGSDIAWIDADNILVTAQAQASKIITLSTGAAKVIAPAAQARVGGGAYFEIHGKGYAAVAANRYGKVEIYDISGASSELVGTTEDVGTTDNTGVHISVQAEVNDDTATLYIWAPNNGLAKYSFKVPAGDPDPDPAETKTFTVTVPQGTQHVYVVGSFADKNWTASDPYELTRVGTTNQFTGTFECDETIEYKYLNGKDWDFGEAKFVDGNMVLDGDKPAGVDNRSYNETDVVERWVATPSVTLNVSFETGVNTPANLFVRGGWDEWAAGKAMTKSGDTYSVTINEKTYANTEYKYYSNDPSDDNWEANADGSDRSNRWAIYPAMSDKIEAFKTEIPASQDPDPQPEVGELELVFKKTDYAWNVNSASPVGPASRSAAYYDGNMYVADYVNGKLHVLDVADGTEGTSIDNANFKGYSVSYDTKGNRYVTNGSYGMTNYLNGTIAVAGVDKDYVANNPSATGGRIDFVSAYGDLATSGYLAGATINGADKVSIWKVENGEIQNGAEPVTLDGVRHDSFNSGATVAWIDENNIMVTSADRDIVFVTFDFENPTGRTTELVGGEFKLHAPVGGGAYFRTVSREFIALPKNQYGALAVYDVKDKGAYKQVGETTANVGAVANGSLHVSVHATTEQVGDNVVATIYVWAPNNGLAVYTLNLGEDTLVGVEQTEAVKEAYRIKQTASGISIDLEEAADIQLYNLSGMMLDNTVATGTYSRDLANGIYIIRINGQAIKFVK